MPRRTFSAVLVPKRGSAARRPSPAAASRSASDSIASESWIWRTLAAPRPGMRSISRGQLDHARGEQGRGLACGFEGQGVVHAMKEQAAGSGPVRKGPADPLAEVVAPQTLPHRLPGTLGDAKRSHLPRPTRVAKIAGDG